MAEKVRPNRAYSSAMRQQAISTHCSSSVPHTRARASRKDTGNGAIAYRVGIGLVVADRQLASDDGSALKADPETYIEPPGVLCWLVCGDVR